MLKSKPVFRSALCHLFTLVILYGLFSSTNKISFHFSYAVEQNSFKFAVNSYATERFKFLSPWVELRRW